MEIMPNSTIHFLRNIPFDNDYNDTYYFDSLSEQEDFFTSAENNFIKYTINDQYYIRHSANVIDVQIPNLGTTIDSTTGNVVKLTSAESLFDCNYMMFCNENFGSFVRSGVGDDGYLKKKWFYAFVTDIEYVNNEVARVTFEIDVMQTWMFDYELEQCFIEREHSATDEIGDNIVPENLDLGYDTICVDEHILTLNCHSILLIADKNPDGTYPDLSVSSGGIPYTLSVNRYDLTQQGEGARFINELNAYLRSTSTNLSPEDILYICLCPKFINNSNTFEENLMDYHDNVGLRIKRPTQLGKDAFGRSYTPKNNKLFTYPYCFVTVSNRQGNSQIYKFEHFVNTAGTGDPNHYASFILAGESLYIPSVCLYPQGYNLIEANPSLVPTENTYGFEYGIGISEFPQLATVGDTFKAWWAQNKNSFAANGMSNLAQGAVEMASGFIMASADNPRGFGVIGEGMVSMAFTIKNAVAKKQDTQNLPGVVNGLTNTSFILSSANALGYILMAKTINREQAEIIDNYFSMFGYASHKVKIPFRHIRKSWTYTQTVGCTIKGKLPASYQRKICRIYDKGIRFWDKEAEFGIYSQDNSCII